MVTRSLQGSLVLTPSRQRDWSACRRRYYLAHVINLTPSDPDVGHALGTLVHEELANRHRAMETHDEPGPAGAEGHSEPEVLAHLDRHRQVCPRDGADYLGGEVDLRWYVKSKALLISGRLDAMWRRADGAVEIRDYKTRSCPDDLRTDFAAGIYALLTAAQAAPPLPGPGIHVTYECLAGEAARVISSTVDRAWLESTWDAVLELASEIRSERDFAPNPSPACSYCNFRSVCPAAPAAF